MNNNKIDVKDNGANNNNNNNKCYFITREFFLLYFDTDKVLLLSMFIRMIFW